MHVAWLAGAGIGCAAKAAVAGCQLELPAGGAVKPCCCGGVDCPNAGGAGTGGGNAGPSLDVQVPPGSGGLAWGKAACIDSQHRVEIKLQQLLDAQVEIG